MPTMSIHKPEIENTHIELDKSKNDQMAWIDLSLPEYGDYLTFFLHADQGTLKFLIDLEAAIQEALAFLVSCYELPNEEKENAFMEESE